MCKSCMKNYRKEYKVKYKKEIAERNKIYKINNKNIIDLCGKRYNDKHKEKIKLKRQNRLENIILYSASRRAKIKNFEFDIELKDIIIPKYCPVFPNIELVRTNSKQLYNSPTLDRINNNKGYTKENIEIISWRANDLKGDASFEEYEKLYNFYVNGDKPVNSDIQKITNKAYLYLILRLLKSRAKRKNINFSLTKSQIKDLFLECPSHCPVLNIPLIHSNKQTNNSISIDRIDNSKGYDIDNIGIISWRANNLKSFATKEDIKIIYLYLKNKLSCTGWE